MIEPKRILIIDDDLFSIASISQTLLHDGYQILHAADHIRALKVIERDEPDLIICSLDERRPNVDRLMQTVEQTLQGSGIPYFFILQSQRRGDGAPDILGPKQYLTKPFTHEQLAMAVEDHLRLRKQSHTRNSKHSV